MLSFDIFRGRYGDKDVAWIEAVEGLAAARERMEEIAAEQPGDYFVFSAYDRRALAVINRKPVRRSAISNPSNKAGAA